MRWQRLTRLALLVLALATIVGIYVSVRKPTKRPGGSVQRQDPKAPVEATKGVLSQSNGMRIPGIISFDHQSLYDDGSMKLLGLKVTTHRTGREFHMAADEGHIGKEQSHMESRGHVVLTASDGLRVTTDEATYSNGEQIVRAPHHVEFTHGDLSGSGMGMTYDQQRDVLWLLDQAVINVAPDKKTKDPGAKIVSGAAGLARREHYMRFERSMSVVRGGRTISADTAMAYLTDDEKKIKSLELRGNSRIAMGAPATGGLQAMGSRDMNITYGPDGETIQHAILVGGGVIQMAGAAGKPGRRIAGDTVDVTLGDDGAVTSLVARDHMQLTIPGDKDTPERTIKAGVMEGKGEPGKGLTGATFRNAVEFREERSPNPRLAHSTTLTTVLTSDGGLDDAQFGGGTHFVDGTTTAAALDARYLVSKGHLELSGKIGAQEPQVQDDRITVDATAIDLTFDGPKMIAKGDVQSVMKAQKKEGAAGTPGTPGTSGTSGTSRDTGQGSKSSKSSKSSTGSKAAANASTKPPPKTPGMLKDDQPAYVTAAALDYNGDIDKAIYTGSARLWQGDTAVSGDTITIDEKTGDLFSNGNVRSTLVLEQLDSESKEQKKVPTIATSLDMHYEDAVHRATYTTNAHMIGPQGDLHAVKIEMYLVEGGGSLERAEAYDQVNLKTDIRTATGSRLTYFAVDERYLMRGAPVTIVEDCRQTTGKTCTFWRSTDRILVDGEDRKRTLATSGGTCGSASPK